MEQLIIFVLFVVVSIISSIVQHRKKAQEEARARGELPPTVAPRGQKPVTQWPRNVGQWQDQLKRMLEENAPPVIKPVIVPEKRATQPGGSIAPATIVSAAPEMAAATVARAEAAVENRLRQSRSGHTRVSNLYSRVAERMRAAGRRATTIQRPAPVQPRAASGPLVQRLASNPAALRDAFVASVIFSPPKAFETAEER